MHLLAAHTAARKGCGHLARRLNLFAAIVTGAAALAGNLGLHPRHTGAGGNLNRPFGGKQVIFIHDNAAFTTE